MITYYYPVGIAISDFDQDGKQDVVVRFIDSLGIGVLLGNGDGMLRTITIYSTAPEDFNGDGMPDIVVIAGSVYPGPGISGAIAVFLYS